jgi:hypothetical protein
MLCWEWVWPILLIFWLIWRVLLRCWIIHKCMPFCIYLYRRGAMLYSIKWIESIRWKSLDIVVISWLRGCRMWPLLLILYVGFQGRLMTSGRKRWACVGIISLESWILVSFIPGQGHLLLEWRELIQKQWKREVENWHSYLKVIQIGIIC